VLEAALLMSVFRPNTTVSIYRAQSNQDEYGVTSDDNATFAASGVPVAITEGFYDSFQTRQEKFLPASQRGTLIEYFTIRFRPGSDIQEGDRVYDERNQIWFQVNSVIYQYALVGYSDVRAGATRIANTSKPVNG
jgi:hypothetical protein